jgi:hypothetical protein
MILTDVIWFSFAAFLISIVNLFSSLSSASFSRSNSRIALVIIRLFSLITSFRGFSLPSKFPIVEDDYVPVQGVWILMVKIYIVKFDRSIKNVGFGFATAAQSWFTSELSSISDNEFDLMFLDSNTKIG